MVRIGQDVTRKLEYIPGKFEIVEYIRPRYARPEQDQNDDLAAIVQAPAPDQVLPKSIAGAGLLTQLMIAKYVDHLPLYRQQQMFKRDHGYEVSTSTLGNWFVSIRATPSCPPQNSGRVLRQTKPALCVIVPKPSANSLLSNGGAA